MITENIPEVQDRIGHLIKTLGKNYNRFANELGVDNTVISYIVKGSKHNGGKRNKPSFDLLTKIVDAYPQVCLEWLILGTGPMFRDEVHMEREKQEELVKPITLLELELEHYRKREAEMRERETQLLETISNLSKHSGK